MWDCIKCGVKAIAGDLGFCPGCFKPKENNVPRGTTGGASNEKAEPGEPGYIDPGAEEAAGKAEAAKAFADAGLDPEDVARLTGTAQDKPEKPAEAPVAAKAGVPAVDLRPAGARSVPPADTSGQKDA
jgi:hypothetical protein